MKIIVIILAIIFIILPRWIYHTADPRYYFFPDSFSYIDRALEISSGKTLVHPRRLPLYPLVIGSLLPIDKDTVINFEIIKQGRSVDFRPVKTLQMSFGIIGGLIFALITLKLFGKGWKFLLMMIIYGMDLYIFGWEKNILTESLMMNFLIIYLYFLYQFISSNNLLFLFISVLVESLAFLLKPSYLFLSFFCLPILLYHLFKNRKKNQFFSVILISLLSLVVPLYYRFENKRIYNYEGISVVFDYNLMGKVIQYELDTSKIKIDKDYDEVLKICATSRKNKAELRKINDCIKLLNLKNDSYNINANTLMGKFARKTIMSQPVVYFVKSFFLLPTVFTEQEEGWIVINQKPRFLNNLWNLLSVFYRLVRYITLSFLIFYPFSIFQFFKKPDRTNTIIILAGTIVFYGIIVSTFFAHVEYDRLRSAVEPLLLLICFYYLFNLHFYVKRICQ